MTQSDIDRVFSNITMENDVLTVSKREGDFERLEMINAKNKAAIHIHIVDFKSGRDIQYYITPDWIYKSDTMTKVVNPYDPTVDADFQALLEDYTELLGGAFYTKEMILDLALSLHQTHHYKGSTNIIRGINPNQHGAKSDQVQVVEIRYRDDMIKELHFQLEYNVDSTKKESNYISGTHLYFSDQLPMDFPELSRFTETED